MVCEKAVFYSHTKYLISETQQTLSGSVERINAIVRLLEYLIDNRLHWIYLTQFSRIVLYKAREFKSYSYINNDIPISEEMIERIRGLCEEIEYA